MAPRGLKATLFHLFAVPVVWAIVLYVAVRTHYDFSRTECIWMTVELFGAILFRIVVTMELCWGLENCLLQIHSYYGRRLALYAIRFIFCFFTWYTLNGTTMFLAQRNCISMELFEDRQYWCFLTFLLMGYYELVAFFDLALLRVLNINKKSAELKADPAH